MASPDDMVATMTVEVDVVNEVSHGLVEAFDRLMPQLSPTAKPLDELALMEILRCEAITVLVARAEGEIVGTLTLVIFPIPSGLRAWIEDVVVDEAARGRGVGEALTKEAIRRAQGAGAHTVDLTSRPSREAASRMYERLGFQRRGSTLYRFTGEALNET
jgi:ribosomal protein S18 acetylase RimI-like enzyme